MKLSKLIIGIAMAAIVAACGNASSAKADATSGTGSAVTAAEIQPVIEWTGGKISPDKDLPTVIDFNADWCGPCRKFAPVFHEVAGEFKGRFRFISVNVDNCPEAAAQFGVSSIPQITILRPDGSRNSAIGYMTADELKMFLSM